MAHRPTCTGMSKELQESHVFNSGLTSPQSSYPNDPTPASFWPRGYTQLSMAGSKQSHNLGQFIRRRYGNILSDEYQPQEVYMRSVDDDSSLMSAQAVLSGMYSESSEVIGQPVHTVPLRYEMLFGHPSECPHLRDLLQHAHSSSAAYDLYSKHKDVIDHYLMLAGFQLNQKIPQKISTFVNLTLDIITSHLNNASIPEWASPDVLDNLSSLVLERKEELLDDYDILRLTIGPLVDEILNRTLHKVEGTLNPSLRMYLYSAPSVSLEALLIQASALDRLVPVSSAIFFELHRMGSVYEIQVVYRNGMDHAAVPLTLDGCFGDSCELEDFVHWMLHKAYDGDLEAWMEDCRHGHHHNIGGVVAIAIVIAMLLVGLFAMVYWCNKKRKGEIGYRESAQ
ncbi:hypothetical protein CAPTEDRAFT_194977 [Capitella teleta]|uniref:acid phosphatase n=1 Tax=Capitella teleta TaxID=283909 RepID=R7VG66_CAPTE|nr:hypothetical protein CAPTEDRAFT_194977 [Capitella teleta]|eukprot:ELU17838.1 hypothetical protein CAPTEDRAFT_194977 [Capitella teleta]